MAKNVHARTEGKTVHFQISHDVLAKADANLLADCVQALLDCAETHKCLDGRVALNANCLATVAKHNEATSCVARCFGCS